VRRDRQVPARSGRAGRDDGAPRPGDVAGAVDRVRRVLRVRGRAAGVRRGADAARGCVVAQLAVTASGSWPARCPGSGGGPAGTAGAACAVPPCAAAISAATGKCATIEQDFTDAISKGPLAGIVTLSNDIASDVQKDPAVKKATQQWSACMARNGYSYQQPQN